MAYVDSDSGQAASGDEGMSTAHGVLVIFFVFLGLYMLASYGIFRKINNAL